jgi:hypothetical protein
MANLQTLQPGNVNHTITPEEAQKGGIQSGITRRKNAIIKNSLQKILNMGIKVPQIDPKKPMDKDIKELLEKLESAGVDIKNLELVDLMNYGQMLGAIFGKAECYKGLLETHGENQDIIFKEPHVTSIEEIIDNSSLDKDMYEANKH